VQFLRAFWILPKIHRRGDREQHDVRLVSDSLRVSGSPNDRHLTKAELIVYSISVCTIHNSEVENLKPASPEQRCGSFYAPKYAASSSAVPLNVSRSTCP
jgi:hypothetical protein